MTSFLRDNGAQTAIVSLVFVRILYQRTPSSSVQLCDMVVTQSAFALSLGKTPVVKYSLTA